MQQSNREKEYSKILREIEKKGNEWNQNCTKRRKKKIISNRHEKDTQPKTKI